MVEWKLRRNRIRERFLAVCMSISITKVAILLYVFAILWWIAFPMISLSTGELKPRGLYVDEHGLSVGTGSWSPRYKPTDSSTTTSDGLNSFFNGVPLSSKNTHHSLCEFVTSEVICQYVVISDGSNNDDSSNRMGITQITIDHAWKAASLEVTVVVLAYHESNLQHSLVFVNEVIEKVISNDWLAKRVVMLLLPVPTTASTYDSHNNHKHNLTVTATSTTGVSNQTCHHISSLPAASLSISQHQWISYSNTLQQWLESYHQHQSPQHCCGRKRPFFMEYFEKMWRHGYAMFFGKDKKGSGLIRDAYVIDFTEPHIGASPSPAASPSPGPGADTLAPDPVWSTVQLLLVGNNGQLPNMDFVSAPMASFPDALVAEGDFAALRRKVRAHLGVMGVGHQKQQQKQRRERETVTTTNVQGKDPALPDSDFQDEKGYFRSPLIKTLSRCCDQLTDPMATSDWSTTINILLMEWLHEDGLKYIRIICRRYVDRLEGLIGFQLALIDGPTGLHGQFLSMNIDAITLRPVKIRRGEVVVVDAIPQITVTAATNAAANDTSNTPSPSPTAITTPPTAPITTAPEVYNLALMTVEGLLRLSSGLHEELHHSLWMYILMGSRHFVGISEYAPTLLLALMPLLVMYFTMASRLRMSYFHHNDPLPTVDQKATDAATDSLTPTTSKAGIPTNTNTTKTNTSNSITSTTTSPPIITIAATTNTTTTTSATDGLVLLWHAALALALDAVPAAALLLIIADTPSTTPTIPTTSTPTQCLLPSTSPSETTPTSSTPSIFAPYPLSFEYPYMMQWWTMTYGLSLLWVVCSTVYSVKYSTTHTCDQYLQEHQQQHDDDDDHKQQQPPKQQQQHRHHHQAYTTVMLLSMIIGVCWVGCQHYAFAFPLGVIFSPVSVMLCWCARINGVLDFPFVATASSTTTATTATTTTTVTSPPPPSTSLFTNTINRLHRILSWLLLLGAMVVCYPYVFALVLQSFRTILCPQPSVGLLMTADTCSTGIHHLAHPYNTTPLVVYPYNIIERYGREWSETKMFAFVFPVMVMGIQMIGNKDTS